MAGIRMNRALYLLGMVALLLTAQGCATNPISFDAGLPTVHGALFEYPYFGDQPTGIAVSHQGRIFVSFPRWDKDPLNSVVEVTAGGALRPYPNNDWNRWGRDESRHPEAHFVCIQSVVVDSDDVLWVLDPASPGFKGVVQGGAKLVGIDLATDTVQRVIPFDAAAVPHNSYLNDVRIDPVDRVAYITDSGLGAILVVDLASGSTRRLLADHPSTKAESTYVPVIGGTELLDDQGRVPQIHADGIALDAEGEYLYYHALTGRTLYRIKTAFLKDRSLSEEQLGSHVERVVETGAVDGMVMDADDNLYLTSIEDNAIKRYRPGGEVLETVVRDDRLQWPDSIDIGPDEYLYFTASQINRMPRFNYGKDRRIVPYEFFKTLLPP